MHETLDDLRSTLHLYDTIRQGREAPNTAALISRCEEVAGEMYSDVQGRLNMDEAGQALDLIRRTCKYMTVRGFSSGNQCGQFRFLVQRISEVSVMLWAMGLVEAGGQSRCLHSEWFQCTNYYGIRNAYVRRKAGGVRFTWTGTQCEVHEGSRGIVNGMSNVIERVIFPFRCKRNCSKSICHSCVVTFA